MCFKCYWQTVSCLIEANVKHRTTAIKLNNNKLKSFDGKMAVERLFKSLDGNCWNHPKTNISGNWKWRDTSNSRKTESEEVELERKIIDIGKLDNWNYQMSTSSGLRGPHTDKRAAIDLIRKYGEDHFVFIELKVASDNPLYAAFEILGYGLAYMHARRSGQYVDKVNKIVMSAKRIDLVVLGPEKWFTYKIQGKLGKFEFKWITDALEEGLNSIFSDGIPQGIPHFRFRFESFKDSKLKDNPKAFEKTANEIIEKFGVPHEQTIL